MAEADLMKDLVWSGYGTSGPGNSHGIHVCKYRGGDHLCFYQGNQMLGYGRGHGVIMDKHYRIVKSVEPAGSAVSMDEHEFILESGGKTALHATYHPRAYDLTQWGIDNGFGWVQDNVFQEVDVETGKLLFEWRALDYIGLEESYVGPMESEVAGDGRTKETPWDYFHINSIAKNSDGDYLISARHVSAVYKISGQDGHIMWRLHGAKSDYDLEDFDFSSQHDARFISEDANRTVISLFDNASNGYNQTGDFSSSLKIELDHRTKTARVLQRYEAPDKDGGLLARSQGNTQVLPNGNVVSGFGNNCFMSEHTEDGTPVFYGWIALTGTMIYRVHKANWTAEPLTTPNLVIYSREKKDMAFYVSWNGATEVTHWKFYGANSKDGPYDPIAVVEKAGFETRYQHHGFKRWAYVEGLHHNQVLSQSSVEKAFVPGTILRSICDDWACPMSQTIDQANAAEVAQQEEEERELEAARAEIERVKDERKATTIKIGAGILILLGLALISRSSVRRVMLSVLATLCDMQDQTVYKLHIRRGHQYHRLNSS